MGGPPPGSARDTHPQTRERPPGASNRTAAQPCNAFLLVLRDGRAAHPQPPHLSLRTAQCCSHRRCVRGRRHPLAIAWKAHAWERMQGAPNPPTPCQRKLLATKSKCRNARPKHGHLKMMSTLLLSLSFKSLKGGPACWVAEVRERASSHSSSSGVVTGEQDACGGVTTIPSLLRRAESIAGDDGAHSAKA